MLNLKERPIASIKLVGGRLCLDFVNTIGGRKDEQTKRMVPYVIRDEKLNDYFDLLAWGSRVGMQSEEETQKLVREALRSPAEAYAVWKRAIALREAVYRISRAVVQGKSPQHQDLEVLNQEVRVAQSRRIVTPERTGFVWEWDDPKPVLDRLLWAISVSAAEMLTASDLTRLRQCPGEDCGWLFDDSTRNRSRQWCDMKDCGNVAKVRRFRSRSR